MAYREMSDVTRIQYLRSEITVPSTVYEVAGQIYAAYVQAGRSTGDDRALMEKAVADAIELALTTERVCAGTGTISGGLE